MRGILKGLAGLIILLAILWLGGWFLAEMRLKQLVTARIDKINQTGLEHISYDSLVLGRSPLTASIKLINPLVSVKDTLNADGGAAPDASADTGTTPLFNISAASFGAHIDLLAPLLLHLDVPTTINIISQKASGVLTFNAVSASETLSPGVWMGDVSNPVTGGKAEFSGINLLASSGSLQVAQIGRLSVHETLDTKAGTNGTAVSLEEELDDLQLSPIIAKLINLPFGGQLKHLALTVKLSGPFNWQDFAAQNAAQQDEAKARKFQMETLHQWALAGGHAEATLNAQLGPSQFAADGKVAFDSTAQPSGDGNLTADQLDQLTAALTGAYPWMQDWVNEIQARMSPYLSTSEQTGQQLSLHSKFGKDGIFLNGQRTGDMPPLDWDKLINPPPPPPPQAPGDGSGADSP